MRSTHTYVLLEVSPAAHAEIRDKLKAAGYDHAIDIDGNTVDMHGLALIPSKKPSTPATDKPGSTTSPGSASSPQDGSCLSPDAAGHFLDASAGAP